MRIRLGKFVGFLTFLTFVLCCGAKPSHAQTFVSQGKGTFVIDGESSALVKAGVTLVNDGRVIIEVQMRDLTTLKLSGRYTGKGLRREVSITSGLASRRSISGHGAVSLYNHSTALDSISVTGKVDGDSYELTFNSSNREEERADRDFSLSQSEDGNGRLDIGKQRYRITHMTIHLSSNGDLAMTVEGPEYDDTSWTGTWSGSGSKLTFKIHQKNSLRQKATGTLTLNSYRRKVNVVEFDGKEGNDFLRLYFERDS